MKANSLHNPNVIYVGQQLIIPEKSSYGTGGPQCATYYTVRQGDTLSQIALNYGVDVYVLARANGITDLNDVYVGQSLCIPGSGGNNYPQQPSYPQEKPQQQPQQQPQKQPPSNQPSCNPCGQPTSDGRPPGEAQRPNNQGPQCDGPCGGPQQPNGQGPQCNAPCEGPQQPNNQGPQCNDSCEGPHSNKPQCNDPCQGPKHPGGERPTETWKGTYFNDKYFTEFALERQDVEVNFNWGIGSPDPGIEPDRFSVRWEKVAYFKAGPYRFTAVADDGVRVYVDDQLIIDAWVIQPATEYKADINLSDGPHKVVVEYYEEAEDAQIHVFWEQRRQHK
jgi:LysM repeat protein